MRPIRIALAAALLLPLAFFAMAWATTWRTAQQGQDWLIPIKGYDPRDLLRGHYVQYRYDWPQAAEFNPEYVSALCVEGRMPNIRSVREYGEAMRDRCTIVIRATADARREARGLDRGILFVSQARAAALSRQLSDQKLQGLLKVRIRPDGVMRPIDIVFRPRPAPSAG